MDNDPRRWLFALRYSNKLAVAAGDIVLNLSWRVATVVSLYYITDFIIYCTSYKFR